MNQYKEGEPVDIPRRTWRVALGVLAWAVPPVWLGLILLEYYGLFYDPRTGTPIALGGWTFWSFLPVALILSALICCIFAIAGACSFSRSIRLTGYGIRVSGSKRTIEAPWSTWRPNFNLPFFLRGVGLASPKNSGGPGVLALLTREQANAVFSHPMCPHWNMPEKQKKVYRVAW